jgi:hypothetical protein
MIFLCAKIGTLRFDHGCGAFEGRVHITTTRGTRSITARAYLPIDADPGAVEAQMIAVARRWCDAAGSAG